VGSKGKEILVEYVQGFLDFEKRKKLKRDEEKRQRESNRGSKIQQLAEQIKKMDSQATNTSQPSSSIVSSSSTVAVSPPPSSAAQSQQPQTNTFQQQTPTAQPTQPQNEIQQRQWQHNSLPESKMVPICLSCDTQQEVIPWSRHWEEHAAPTTPLFSAINPDDLAKVRSFLPL
jgi:ATPase subunit of ABC transporter with duplicated ATPase domains